MASLSSLYTYLETSLKDSNSLVTEAKNYHSQVITLPDNSNTLQNIIEVQEEVMKLESEICDLINKARAKLINYDINPRTTTDEKIQSLWGGIIENYESISTYDWKIAICLYEKNHSQQNEEKQPSY